MGPILNEANFPAPMFSCKHALIDSTLQNRGEAICRSVTGFVFVVITETTSFNDERKISDERAVLLPLKVLISIIGSSRTPLICFVSNSFSKLTE